MESLYVCLFSTGHIKVGRSKSPKSRIKQHADRVAVVGVSLLDSRTFSVVADVEARELDLIRRCEASCQERLGSEWFSGLAFADVCEWANNFATSARPEQQLTPLQKYLKSLPKGGHLAFARSIGVAPAFLCQMASGSRQPGHALAVTIERVTRGQLTRPELRTDWEKVWPDFYSLPLAHECPDPDEGGIEGADPLVSDSLVSHGPQFCPGEPLNSTQLAGEPLCRN